MKKILSIILVLVLALGTFSLTFADDIQFTDVKEGSWYYSDVTSLVKVGGINGYPDGTFKPNGTITAAEFIKITVGIYDDTLNVSEKKDGEKWYTPYVNTALSVGIVPDGMFTEEDYNKPISREKMAVIMAKTAENLLKEEPITEQTKIDYLKAMFSDYNAICDYCKDYVLQAAGKGIIGGYPDGTFKPNGNATRAEAATMLVRLSYSPKRLVMTFGEISKTPLTKEQAQSYLGNTKAYGYFDYYLISPEDAVTMFKLDFRGNSPADNYLKLPERFHIWHLGNLTAILNDGTSRATYISGNMKEPTLNFVEAKIEDVKYFELIQNDIKPFIIYICENPFI